MKNYKEADRKFEAALVRALRAARGLGLTGKDWDRYITNRTESAYQETQK